MAEQPSLSDTRDSIFWLKNRQPSGGVMERPAEQSEVHEARDVLVQRLENANIRRSEAFLIVQAIERFIAAKLSDR